MENNLEMAELQNAIFVCIIGLILSFQYMTYDLNICIYSKRRLKNTRLSLKNVN